MIITYPFDDMDYERQKNEVLDVKNEDVHLKVNFKDCVKVYGIIFTFVLLLVLLVFKDLPFWWIITLCMCLICFIAIFVLYFFQSYQIRYDSIQQSLIIKKWYGTINIPKRKLKKVYIKYARRAGANLYIGYLNDKSKEKYILSDIFLLKCNELKDFLDIFII